MTSRLFSGVVVLTAVLGSAALVQTMIRGSQIMSHTVTTTQLDTTGVAASTYGDATHIGAFTVGADGRISTASNVAVSGLPATSAKGDILASNSTAFQVQGVGSDGQVLTADAASANGVKWAAGGSGGAAITASVYNSSNQTLTHGTEATLAFDSEDYDASGMHDPSTNNSRLTVPTGGGGVYTLIARVKFTAAFSGAVHVRFYKNGALVTETTASGADLSTTNEYHQASASLSLVATDYVEVKALVELAAGSGTITTASGTGNTQFQAVEAVSAAAPASNGALILLEQHTASSSASLNFTSCLSSTYDEYAIHLVNLIPATNAVDVYLRMSTDGGSTYAAGTNYQWSAYRSSKAGSASAGATAAAQIDIGGGGAQSSTATTGGVVGSLSLFGPGSTSVLKRISGTIATDDASTSPDITTMMTGAYTVSGTAVNAFQVLFSSGNIASGVVRCYGVAK